MKRAFMFAIHARSIRFVALASLFTVHCSLFTVPAQDDEPIPPPPIIVTKEERQKLDAQTDTKERVKLSIDLMDARLTVAEKFSTAQDFELMFRELGGFHGLLDNAMERLERQSGSDRKVLDNYKRYSLGIRGFATRLEVIRRDIPLQYEDYVRKLLIHIRDLQTKAAEPFFKNTVVPNQKP
ncbi:MAG: hypothetical protein ABL952_05225 [Pyrinomonadaceae bacterium]